jgi:small-conductance mechanosensitive channel
MTYENIGSAILITAAGYFYFAYHLTEWLVVAMIILAVVTMTYPGFTKERKKQLEATLELTKAKTEYYRRKTQ